jgi:hypothetical protein
LWVPRSQIQGILDSAPSDPAFQSAVNSLLQSSGQFILKSTIQSLLNSTPESTTQPAPESTTQPASELTTQPAPESTTQPASESTIIIPDNRPIWPGRPELIYRQYLAEKEAWLADNPGFGTPASYRRSRGLEIYSAVLIRRYRHALPLWRLDLDTETLLKDDIAEWSNEEISAWLDWKEVQDQEATREADRQVEAELIKAGGFGRSKERGVRGLWDRIDADIEARNVQYRFTN